MLYQGFVISNCDCGRTSDDSDHEPDCQMIQDIEELDRHQDQWEEALGENVEGVLE